KSRVFSARPDRSNRGNLPAHLSVPVSANEFDAGFVAQPCPLSGRSFYPPSERLRHLPHEGSGGVLQQRRSVELPQGESQRPNLDHAAVLHHYALARRVP